MISVVLIALLGAPVFAQDVEEQAPKYLLGDLGVRVDMPTGWTVTRWSDWDLKAESVPSGVLLFAWTTPYQVRPTAENLDQWGTIATSKASELRGKAPKVTASELGSFAGEPIALTEVSFHFDTDTGPLGWLYAATIPVEGQMFHLATVAAASRKGRAKQQRDALVKRLDIRAAAVELGWGATVSASGVTTQLPKDWRPVLEREKPFLEAEFKLLGITDPEACWTAVRPHPVEAISLMVTCPGSLFLGRVDEYSFEGVDEEVRYSLFRSAPVAPARKLSLADRLAFVYQPPLGDRQLVVGAVPYGRGIARTWALGPEGSEALSSSLEQTIRGSTYDGEHPVGAVDYIRYAVTYRLFLLLIPALLLGLVIIGGAWFLMSTTRKPNYADFEEPTQ